MDYNTQPQQMPSRSEMSVNSFLIASIICAVLSLMSSCVIFSAMFFAGLSILFAALSKGKELKMHFIGKTAVLISVSSLVFSLIITAFSVYTVMHDPESRQAFYEEYEEMTGISLEEEIEQLKTLYQ
ncbi:MAG: hypothetical protein ACI4AA_08365 [Lachnospiraceae bacterium]